jgi:hypothetical protein
MRLKHALIAVFALFGFIIWSCQKESSKTETDKSDVGIAKEWWYGSFRKTPEYSSINLASPLAPPTSSSSKKYPDWAKAISYKKYNFDIVEVPLYHITNNVLLPGMQNLPLPEAARIAKSVTNKLILIKKTDGTTVVRVASIIPSADYAKNNSYDISKLHPNSLPTDFDGYLTIADWKMGLKNFLQIENGKPVKKLRIYKEGYLPKKKTNSTAGQRMVCPEPYEVPHMVWVCAIVPSGDNVADQQHCDEIGHWEEMGTVTVYPDCYDDGEEEGEGIEECLNTNTPEFCDCAIWGLGCEPDGGGGDSPLPELENHVDDPCLKNLVNQVINADCRNRITSFINNTFANSDRIHLYFEDNPILNNTGTDANTSFHPLNSPNWYKIQISLNNNALNNSSSEYIAATILHESVHAWIIYTFNDAQTAAQEHNLMASTSRFNMMKQQLLQMFPGLGDQTASDLTWGGLGATVAYNALPLPERQRIEQVNTNFKTRINNTGTPCVP